jgi:poly(3-hydroxyalkanoate) synthetase
VTSDVLEKWGIPTLEGQGHRFVNPPAKAHASGWGAAKMSLTLQRWIVGQGRETGNPEGLE